MKIFLKNTISLINDLHSYFDGSINEQCLEFNECNAYLPFNADGKPIFGIEYKMLS